MAQLTECTLLYETNCYPDESPRGLRGTAWLQRTLRRVLWRLEGKPGDSRASVWLFAGDGRPSIELSNYDEMSSIPGWTKVVGPIDSKIAVSVHAALKSFLEGNGVMVINEDAIDD